MDSASRSCPNLVEDALSSPLQEEHALLGEPGEGRWTDPEVPLNLRGLQHEPVTPPVEQPLLTEAGCATPLQPRELTEHVPIEVPQNVLVPELGAEAAGHQRHPPLRGPLQPLRGLLRPSAEQLELERLNHPEAAPEIVEHLAEQLRRIRERSHRERSSRAVLEGCRPGDRLSRRGLPEWPHPHPLLEEIGDLGRHLLESSDEVLAEADDQLERETRRGPGLLLSGHPRVEQQGTDLGRDPLSGLGIMKGEDLLELIEHEHRSEQQVPAPDDDPGEERLEIGSRRPRRLEALLLACPVDRPRSHRCEGLSGRVEPDGDREVLLGPQARKETSPEERRLAQARSPEEDQ